MPRIIPALLIYISITASAFDLNPGLLRATIPLNTTPHAMPATPRKSRNTRRKRGCCRK